MTKVLITGVAGMIGSHVADECLSRGWEVDGIDNLSSGRREYIPHGVVNTETSICGPLAYHDGYDFVFHLAAEPFIPKCYDNPAQFVETNIQGTLNFLLTLRDCGKIVVVSSSEVYGTAQHVPMTEHHPLNPQSTYAVTKLAAEQLAMTLHYERQLPIVIFRPFNTQGPRSTQPYVIADILKQIAHDDKHIVFLGNAEAKRDFSFVSDTARAIVETAINGTIGEVYNFGSGKARSIREIAYDIADLFGHSSIEIIDGQTKRLRPHDVQHLQADSQKLLLICQPWELVSWRDGLQRTIEWYQFINLTWPWQN